MSCGDCKTAINLVLLVDQYPLPRPADQFTTLAGGKKSYKIGLTIACQKIALEETYTVTKCGHNQHALETVHLHSVAIQYGICACTVSTNDGYSAGSVAQGPLQPG